MAGIKELPEVCKPNRDLRGRKSVSMIENYITYYNNRRVQRNLGVLTPMEKHEFYLMAA